MFNALSLNTSIQLNDGIKFYIQLVVHAFLLKELKKIPAKSYPCDVKVLNADDKSKSGVLNTCTMIGKFLWN